MTPVDFDTSLLHRVIQLRQPWLDDVMVLASALAAGGFVWVVMALIASLFPRYRAGAWRLLLALGVSLVVTDYIMKPLVDRPRPFVVIADLPVIVGKPASPSFPSGHAARAVAGAVVGARMLPGAGWVLWPFGILVAVSRVYVGVHWPTDVVAGALVGLVCAWWVTGRLSDRRPPGMN